MDEAEEWGQQKGEEEDLVVLDKDGGATTTNKDTEH